MNPETGHFIQLMQDGHLPAVVELVRGEWPDYVDDIVKEFDASKASGEAWFFVVPDDNVASFPRRCCCCGNVAEKPSPGAVACFKCGCDWDSFYGRFGGAMLSFEEANEV